MQLLILLSVVRVQKHWVPVVLLLLRLMFKITLGCYILQKTANLDKVLKMAMTLKQNVVFCGSASGQYCKHFLPEISTSSTKLKRANSSCS